MKEWMKGLKWGAVNAILKCTVSSILFLLEFLQHSESGSALEPIPATYRLPIHLVCMCFGLWEEARVPRLCQGQDRENTQANSPSARGSYPSRCEVTVLTMIAICWKTLVSVILSLIRVWLLWSWASKWAEHKRKPPSFWDKVSGLEAPLCSDDNV